MFSLFAISSLDNSRFFQKIPRRELSECLIDLSTNRLPDHRQ